MTDEFLDAVASGKFTPKPEEIVHLAENLIKLRADHFNLKNRLIEINGKYEDLQQEHDELRGYFSDGEKAFAGYSAMRTICEEMKKQFDRLDEFKKEFDDHQAELADYQEGVWYAKKNGLPEPEPPQPIWWNPSFLKSKAQAKLTVLSVWVFSVEKDFLGNPDFLLDFQSFTGHTSPV